MFQIVCTAAVMAVLGINIAQAAPVGVNRLSSAWTSGLSTCAGDDPAALANTFGMPVHQNYGMADGINTTLADVFVMGLLQSNPLRRDASVGPSGTLIFDLDSAMRPGATSRIKLARGRNGPPSRPGRARSRSSHR